MSRLFRRRPTVTPAPTARRAVTYRPGPPVFDQLRDEARAAGRDPWADDPDRTVRRESVDDLLADMDLLAFPIATGTLVGRREVA